MTSTFFTLLALPAFYALAHQFAAGQGPPGMRRAGAATRSEPGTSDP